MVATTVPRIASEGMPKLTKRAVDSAEPREKPYLIFDDEVHHNTFGILNALPSALVGEAV